LSLPPPPQHFPYTTLFRSMLAGIERGHSEPGMTHRLRAHDDHLDVVAREQRLNVVGHGHIVVAAQNPRILVGPCGRIAFLTDSRSEEHTSELQSRENLVCR